LPSLFHLSLPGILSSIWSYSSQAADASAALAFAGHGCLFQPVFAERRQNLTNFGTPFERNEFSRLIRIPAPGFHRDKFHSAGMTNTKNAGTNAAKAVQQDMESGAALKRIQKC